VENLKLWKSEREYIHTGIKDRLKTENTEPDVLTNPPESSPMKATAEKSSHSSVPQQQQSRNFFSRSADGSFFARAQTQENFLGRTTEKVGVPDDKYEQQADRVADKVADKTVDVPEIVSPSKTKAEQQSTSSPAKKEAEPTATAPTTSEQQPESRTKPEPAQSDKKPGTEPGTAPVKETEQSTAQPDKKAIELPAQADKTQATERKTPADTAPKPAPEVRDSPQTKPGAEEETLRNKKRGDLENEGFVSGKMMPAAPAAKSGGQPLPSASRSEMEPAIGAGFDHVRIHTDDRSASANRELNSRAYTLGNHIYFGQGQFNPETREGRRLLAHELTHVVQQTGPESHNRKAATPGMQASAPRSSATGITSTGGTLVQRGLLDRVRSGLSNLSQAVIHVITEISTTINMGMEAAFNFISSLAGRLRLGIVAAWNWIRRVAGVLREGILGAWNFVQLIAGLLRMAISTAWDWVQVIASALQTGARDAWNWVNRLADALGIGNTAAWQWINNSARRIGMGVRAGWEWIRSMARRATMAYARFWSWIDQLSRIARMGITQTWTWISTIATNIGLGLSEAWSWVQTLARHARMGVTVVWRWISGIAAVMAEGAQAAWNLVEQISDAIGNGVVVAWNWIRRLATTLGRGIRISWGWIREAASLVGLGARAAWNMVVEIASFTFQGAMIAWNWVRNAARTVGEGILATWNFIKNAVRRAGLLVIRGWNLMRELAARLGRRIREGWNWLIDLAARTGMALVRGWNWIKGVAARLGRMIADGWHFVVNAARRLGRAIVDGWNFLTGLFARFFRYVRDLFHALDWWLNAPNYTFQPRYTAADGSSGPRTTIGVAEEVTFRGSEFGDWTASGGDPVSLTTSKFFRWKAPPRAGTAQVSLRTGRLAKTVAFTVVEPTSITGRKLRDLTFDPGHMGAGMNLKFIYQPKNVNFHGIQAGEISGEASRVSGYFKRFKPAQLHHNSGDTIWPVVNNEISGTDTAALWDAPEPWYQGHYEWSIPNRFKADTESGEGKIFTHVVQAFDLHDETGKTTVTKAGTRAERTP
jgi:hypothetical protein